MRYDGNICDGCKKPLQEDEDIVVCPECATPQHRSCYEEKGECVNAHLHGDDFVWQGKVNDKKSAGSSTLINHSDNEGEKLICPNCGHANYPGSTSCNNCNMKFTMFGVNIVEAAQKEEKKSGVNPLTEKTAQKQNKDIPKYEPPFEIGNGEGFSEEESQLSAQRPEGTNPWNLGGYEDYEEINTFKGPFPVEDYTAGVRTNTLGSFIRNNAQSYINKFKWNVIRGKKSFNWAAFLFSPYWFFYRKLYKPGIIFITLEIIIGAVLTPMLKPLLEFYEYILTLNLEEISDQVYFELADKMSLLMMDVMVPMMIAAGCILVMHLVSGIIANDMYKKYCLSNIALGLSKQTAGEKIAVFAKKGGTSLILVLAAYFAQTLLSSLVNYLIV